MTHLTLEQIRYFLGDPHQQVALTRLNPNELLELAALFYLGRGSGRTFASGLRDAKNCAPQYLAQQLGAKVPLNKMVIKGLAKIGMRLD